MKPNEVLLAVLDSLPSTCWTVVIAIIFNIKKFGATIATILDSITRRKAGAIHIDYKARTEKLDNKRLRF